MIRTFLMGIGLSVILTLSSLSAAETNKTQSTKKQELKSNKKQNEDVIDAAKKLLEVMGLKKVYKNAVEASTQRLINANPNFSKIKDKIKQFYEKNIGWDVMKEDLAKLYAKYFTKKELEDITAFYKTPTGQKVLSKMGKLTYEGQMLTRKRLEPHLDELKKLLDSAISKDTKEAKK